MVFRHPRSFFPRVIFLNQPFRIGDSGKVRFRSVNLLGDDRRGMPQDGLHVFELCASADKRLGVPMAECVRGDELSGFLSIGLPANAADNLPGRFRGYPRTVPFDGGPEELAGSGPRFSHPTVLDENPR